MWNGLDIISLNVIRLDIIRLDAICLDIMSVQIILRRFRIRPGIRIISQRTVHQVGWIDKFPSVLRVGLRVG
jgi:hypothetical protein